MADAREVLQQVRAVGEALAQTRLRLAELDTQTMYVQSRATRALGQVRAQLTRLGNTLVPVANVGLNLFRKLLSLLQPVARGLSSVVATLFGTRWTGQAKELDRTAGAFRRTDSAASGAERALNGTAKAARSAAGAAKAVREAQRDLMSFDEINRLSLQTPEAGEDAVRTGGGELPRGRGGAEGGAVKSAAARQTQQGLEVPVSRWAQGLKKLLGEVWEPFRQAWRNRGEFVIQAARAGLEQVRDMARAVGRTWLAVWRDGVGERIVGTVLTIAGELCQVVGNLAERFRIAWEHCGNGERIVRGLFGILEDGVDWVERLVSAAADWAKSLDFSPLLGSIGYLIEAFRGLAGVVENALAGVWEAVLLPLSKWTVEQLAPELVTLLANALKLLAGVLSILQPVAQAVWEHFLRPLAQWTGTAVIAGLHGLNTALEALGGLLGNLAGAASGLGENLSGRLLSGLSGLGEQVRGLFQGAYDRAVHAWDGLRAAFAGRSEEAVSGLSGFMPRVKGLFQQARRRALSAWEGLQESFSQLSGRASMGVKNGLKEGEIRAAFARAYAAACGAWSEAGEKFRSIGARVVSGMRSGLGNQIRSMFSSAYSAACGAWSGAGEKFRSVGASVVNGVRSGLGNQIRGLFSSAYSAACGAWSGVEETFRRFGSGAVSGLRSALSGYGLTSALTEPLRTAGNAAVTLMNQVIDRINSALIFSWGPVQVGGYTLVQAGQVVLAQLPRLNYLAQGGVLTRATAVVAGESGPEAVVPLERNLGWLDRMAELLNERVQQTPSGQPIVVQCVLDGQVIATSTVDYINRRAMATGVNPLSAYI